MKKRILIVAISLLLCCSLIVSGVYAYYKQTNSGYQQNISAVNISFTLNGNNVNTIENYELRSLAKGEESALDFEVAVQSTSFATAIAHFNIDVELDVDYANNELAEAIEVYRYQNGEYEFVCMLDEFSGFDGYLGMNTSSTYYYKLIYSAGAGSYYEDKAFKLDVSATAEIVSTNIGKSFVGTKEMLESFATRTGELNGNIITLTGDITIDDNIAFADRVGIDLNGHTLTINSGKTLTLGYSGSVTSSDAILGITNSGTTGGLAGEGQIVVNTPADCLYIQDNLQTSNISVLSYDLNRLVTAVQQNIEVLQEEKSFRDNDIVDIIKNLHFYEDDIADTNLKLSVVPDSNGTTYLTEGAGGIYSINYSMPTTQVLPIVFGLSKGLSQTSVEFSPTVIGTSGVAIIGSYLDSIPAVIDSSIFLPTYDSASNSTLTWVISNENLLDENGNYLPNGYESLDSWQDQEIKIGLIIDYLGEQSYAEKSSSVAILSARQRTDIIYDYSQIVLEELLSIKDIQEDITTESVNGISLRTKTALQSIEIRIANIEGNNLNNAGLAYIEICDIVEDTNFEGIKYINKPSIDKSAIVSVIINFIYGNGDGTISYEVNQDVVLVGERKTETMEDASVSLQVGFTDNPYINGEGYTFRVKGYTDSGVFADFFVDSPYSNYVLIRNDIYTQANDGRFLLVGGEYKFIDNDRYVYNDVNPCGDGDGIAEAGETGIYELAEQGNGGYILIDEEYYLLSEQTANRYTKEAEVRILPAKVLNADETIVPITAKIWSTKEGGQKQYIKVDDGNSETVDPDLTYNMSLIVKGILHNIPTEIADYNLYNKLLEYYDLDNNGWIETAEARTLWNNATLQANLDTISGQKVVDLRNMDLQSLKGLEYFTGINNLALSGNRLSDLSALSQMYELQYLDLANNLIADVSDLQYLDALTDLNLAHNYISDISYLQYLPNVTNLDLNHNDSLSDFSALTNYQNLEYLDIRQTEQAITEHQNTAYYLSLIYDKNPTAEIFRTTNTAWQASDLERVAAKALSETMQAYEASKTLYVPNTYYYEYTIGGNTFKKQYNLKWETANLADKDYLDFTIDTATGKTTGYEIVSPIIDRNIEILLTVTDASNNTAVNLSRLFNLTLLSSTADGDVYIETSTGNYALASTIIPDPILRSKLFEDFNTNTTGTISGNYTQANTLTNVEINTKIVSSYDYSNLGITNLEGLQYFVGAFDDAQLILSGNIIANNENGVPDLSPLTSLTTLDSLTLSGQLYDFSLISKLVENVPNGLTGLTNLTVVGSYGLDSDDVLASLYHVYLCNPDISIYKDSVDAVWDPYLVPLAKYSQSLPSAYSFINKNETHSLYETADHFFTFRFYDIKDIEFRLVAPTAQNATSSNSFFGFFNSCFEYQTETLDETTFVIGIKYKTLAGYTDTVYSQVVLHGNDGRRDINNSHYIELRADFCHNILVVDYPEVPDGTYVALDEIFPGRSLRVGVMSRLNTVLDSTANLRIDIADVQTNGGYYKAGGSDIYYVSMKTIMDLSFGNGEYTIDGTFGNGESAIQGLQYTSISNLLYNRDANLGTGEYLQNLTTLSIKFSGLDFSTLTEYMPNLTSLRAEMCRFFVAYDGDEYYLKYFNNLTSLVLNNCNIYDWEGLRAFVDIDDNPTTETNKLATLDIVTSVDSDYKNKNNNHPNTVAIIQQIYTNSTATTKTYKIGSLISSTDVSTLYTPETWANASGITELNNSAEIEYREFVNDIEGTGLKVANNLYSLVNDGNIEYVDEFGNLRREIFLPKSTFGMFFGTEYMTESGYCSRDFAINYYFYGIDYQTMNSIESSPLTFQLGNSRNGLPMCYLSTTSDILLKFDQPEHDLFFYIEAVIGEGYYVGSYDANGNYISSDYRNLTGVTKKSFLYPISISGSDTSGDPWEVEVEVDGNMVIQKYQSYEVFKDISLRMQMLLMFAKEGRHLNGAFASEDLSNFTKLSITSTGIDYTYSSANKTITFANCTTATNTDFSKYASSIYSLNGITNLAGLTELSITNAFVSDIDGLVSGDPPTENSTLQVLNLQSNNVTDISVLKYFNVLTDINLSGNPILTTFDANGSFFGSSASTLQVLNLEYAPRLNYADLQALNNAYATSCALTTLKLWGTSAIYSWDSYIAFQNLIDKTTSDSLTISLANSNATAISKTDINNFISDCNGGTISTWRTSGVAVTDTLAEVTGTGQNYTPTLINTYSAGNTYVSSGHTTTLRLTSSIVDFVVDFTIPYSTIGYPDYTITITNNNNISVNSSDFDPAIWAYLISESAKGGTTACTIAKTQISIQTNIGIKSLKGLEKLKLTSLEITNNPVEELWQNTFDSLTSFTLQSAVITEAELQAGIAYATNLATLNLYKVSGIDYLKEVNSTTLADTISGKADLLSVFISNDVNLGVYADSSKPNLFGIINGYYINENKFLNVGDKAYTRNSTMETNGALKANNEKYLQTMDKFLSLCYTTASTNLNQNATSTIYDIYQGHDYASGGSVVSTRPQRMTYDYCRARLLNLSKTENTRTIVPANVYEGDITETQSIIFYFPRYSYLMGKTITFNLSVPSNRSAIWVADTTKSDNGQGYKLEYNVDNFEVVTKGAGVDGYETAITYGASDPYKVKMNYSEVSLVQSTSKTPLFYFEEETVDATVETLTIDGKYLTPANYYIKSTNFLEWLFNNFARGTQVVKLTDNTGYYMTYQCRANTTAITIAHKGITTVEGIGDVFFNLDEFTLTSSAIIALNGLENLTLTSFAYLNSDTSITNYIVQDFTPLFTSRNSLVSFTYNSLNTINIDDLSFLMSFGTQLTSIYLNTTEGQDYTKYFETLSFKYMVSWFEINRPNTKIYTHKNNVTSMSKVNNGDNAYFVSDASYKKATNILSQYESLDSAIDYLHNYELKLVGSGTGVENGIMVQLPAFVDQGGQFYAIKYQSMSSFLQTGNSVFVCEQGGAYSFALPSGSITLNNNSIITYSQLVELSNNSNFMNLRHGGEVDAFVQLSILNSDKNLLDAAFLIARITVDEYDYERMFTIYCSDDGILLKRYVAQLNQTYEYCLQIYQDGGYTQANFATLQGIYNTAKPLLLAQTDAEASKDICEEAVDNMNAVSRLNRVILYNAQMTERGRIYYASGTQITIQEIYEDLSITTTPANIMFNGQVKASTDSVTINVDCTMIEVDPSALPHYFVSDNIVTGLAAIENGYLLTKGTEGGKDIFTRQNLQFGDALTAPQRGAAIYKVVIVCANQIINTIPISPKPTCSANANKHWGNYNYKLTDNGDGTWTSTYTQNEFYYTLTGDGNFFTGYKKEGNTNLSAYIRGNDVMTMQYDSNLDLYYFQYTAGDNVAKLIRAVALHKGALDYNPNVTTNIGHTTPTADNNRASFYYNFGAVNGVKGPDYQFTGVGVDNSGSLSISLVAGTTYTIYFNYRAETYYTGTCTVKENNIPTAKPSDFIDTMENLGNTSRANFDTSATVSGLTTATKTAGIVIANGTYQATKDLIGGLSPWIS